MKITTRHILGSQPVFEFDTSEWYVEFEEGNDRLYIRGGSDGKVYVSSPLNCIIIIEPRATNLVRVCMKS